MRLVNLNLFIRVLSRLRLHTWIQQQKVSESLANWVKMAINIPLIEELISVKGSDTIYRPSPVSGSENISVTSLRCWNTFVYSIYVYIFRKRNFRFFMLLRRIKPWSLTRYSISTSDEPMCKVITQSAVTGIMIWNLVPFVVVVLKHHCYLLPDRYRFL